MKKSLYGINGLVQVNDAVKATSGAPTVNTRGNIGDIIVDSDTGYLYYLSSVASGTYTWIKYGTFTNDVDITGNIAITGDSDLTGALDVEGAVGLTGAVTITGDVDITGDLNVSGDVAIADGSALLVGSGSVTSFAGSGTLVSGVLAILNTNISATDLVFIQRIDANSSTAIGHLSYTIVADTSLTITSLAADATTETADVSNIVFLIVKTA